MSDKISVHIDKDEWYPVYILTRATDDKGSMKLSEETILEIEELQRKFDKLQATLSVLLEENK